MRLHNMSFKKFNHKYKGIKNGNGTWSYSNQESIPFYIKAPQISVKTDNASLQAMLDNHVTTGTGQPNDTVTVKNSGVIYTGTVDSKSHFSVSVPNLKFGDNSSLYESNGTGDKSQSDVVNVHFISSKSNFTITKRPRYVIMDPNQKIPTFVDETGNIPKISGYWPSSTISSNRFSISITKMDVVPQTWIVPTQFGCWFNNQFDSSVLNTNQNIVNYFDDVSLLPGLSGENMNSNGSFGKIKLSNLSTDTTWYLYMGMNFSDLNSQSPGLTPFYRYQSTSSIPFYIKAPQVSVKTDNASLQSMLDNHEITGTDHPNDLVTVKNRGVTYKGTVDSNGHFSVSVPNLKFGDNPSLYEINGTGSRSISDPISFFTGFITIIVPLLINFLLMFLFFPNINPDPLINSNLAVMDQNTLFASMYYTHPLIHAILSIIFASFWGGLFALFAFVSTFFIKNVFVGLCSSFFLQIFLLILNFILKLPNDISYVPMNFIRVTNPANVNIFVVLISSILMFFYCLAIIRYGGEKSIVW